MMPNAKFRYGRETALALSAVLAVGTLFAAGCQLSPAAEKRVRMRARNVARTLDMAARSEQSRPARLARTTAMIKERAETDVHNTQRNFRNIQFYIDRDLNRWPENQQRYQRWLGDVFEGKPENIEPVIVFMFL